jgi:tRNA-specific 2-thiouridylase
VRCNGFVRLDGMLDLAGRLGAEQLATGHYARVEPRPGEAGGGALLRVAVDAAKDQSYMLAGLAPRSVARLRFPLGGLEKAQVRALAAEAGLAVANKRDSQDLCFLAGTGRGRFLARHGGLRERPGAIVDRAGHVLGRHRGHHNFTVGQRRGLGLGGQGVGGLHVLATDALANTVTVGVHEQLRQSTVSVRDLVLHRPGADVESVKLRYRSRPVACELPGELAAGRHGRAEIHLREAVYGAAPGQLACLMAGETIVGHATITR